MKPIDFPAAICKETEMPYNRKHGIILTCWKASILERIKILLIGKVWLAIKSDTIPEILLTGHRKFRIEKGENNEI